MAIRNLVSRLFLIETSRVEELADIIVDVIKILKKEVNKELQINSLITIAITKFILFSCGRFTLNVELL